MKKLLLLSLIYISSTCFSQISNNLVGYWKLNGNAEDETANEIDGSENGSVSYITDGSLGQAASFDGATTSYINLGNNYCFNNITDGITLSAWIKMDADYPDGQNMVISKHHDAWYIAVYHYKVYLCLYIDSVQTAIIGNDTITDSQWHHIAGTWDAATGEFKTYLDGELDVNTIRQADAITPNTARSVFIGNYDGYHYGFHGMIDEAAIFNRALSAEEINNLYQNPGIVLPGSEFWGTADSSIFYNGKVAIAGESVPDGYNFSVDGKIVAKEITVSTDVWSDYVFDQDYTLRSIPELEAFIKENKHLPCIPSENEVIADGIDLGVINTRLLQQLEEITLYIIQLNKKLEILENENKLLKDKLGIE